MKKLTVLATAAALAASVSTGAMAGETIKPLQPLTTAKSTQAPPVSLGLGGLGAGGASGLIVGAVVTTVVIVAATSGT